MMNPATGREAKLGDGTLRLVEPGEAKTVVVVGGGPAGMRFAGTAAERGHKVVLHEAGAELGGHLNLLKQLPTRAGWDDASRTCGDRWRSTGSRSASAPSSTPGRRRAWTRTSSSAPPAHLRAARHPQPLPTGSRRDPGCELEQVLDLGTALDLVLADAGALGSRVLIYDEVGHYLPLGLAEVLSAAGATVEIVTPHNAVGEETIRTQDWYWIAPRLLDAGVTLTTQRVIEDSRIASASAASTAARRWSARSTPWSSRCRGCPATSSTTSSGRRATAP